jgi:hypothetical protein
MEQEFGEMNRRDYEEMIDALETWAAAHPKQKEPFLILMGQSLTPAQFLEEIRNRTELGSFFINYVQEHSVRSSTPPKTFIHRAIEANRFS